MVKIGLLAVILGVVFSSAMASLKCTCTPGHEGIHGNVGIAGPTGEMGAPGFRGGMGPPGRPGGTGDTGDKGSTGPIGGWVGPVGPTGPTGPPGAPGNCWSCGGRANFRYNNDIRSWGSGAGFGSGAGADGLYAGGGGSGFGGGDNGGTGFGSGYGFGQTSSGGGGSGGGGGGNIQGLTAGNMFALPQNAQGFQNFPNHPAAWSNPHRGNGFNSPPQDNIVIIGPNGESMPMGMLQNVILLQNIKTQAAKAEAARPTIPFNAAPAPIITSQAYAVSNTRPFNPTQPPTSELSEWQREVLLGEPLKNQSNVFVGTSATVVGGGTNASSASGSSVTEPLATPQQPFPSEGNTKLDTKQIEESLEEFQQALDEFRKRFAKMSASLNRRGRQLAIVL